ncbi:hypothetical protein HRbin40_00947 [bacterium HR40]|nr:hypothetical protein HRbin40_00947 [bacterium HR40]
MGYLTRWRVALILGVCLFGVLASLPNLVSKETLARLPDWLPKRQITLGLDLQGGSHLLLEVDTEALVRERLENLVSDIRATLRPARIGYRGLGVHGESVVLTLTDPAQTDAALEKLRELNPLVQAIGFTGGTIREFEIEADRDGRITMRLSERGREQLVGAAVQQSLEVVRRRIDELGTREPTIQRQGENRILVQVPGEHDPGRIKQLLGKTARLTFHLVDLEVSLQDAREGRLPPDDMLVASADPNGPSHYVLKRKVELSGEHLVDAQPSFQNNQPVVSFRFDSTGARLFGKITQENVGRLFAIVLDDRVISAPRIREPILGGSGIIEGGFTVEEANELAILLRAGALPAPLHVVEERTVGPELGADSVRAGTLASMLAMVLVALFMAGYYGLFGLFADLALLANLVLMIGSLSVLGATLTLPGIAGIALTIGMAVDSNVLIFERIREEIRAGRSPAAAIESGFSQALRAVVDSNLTTLIAALVLFQFGTGPVKGFAVTLSIGVITTMFTAVTLTRLIIWSWYLRMRPKTIPL